MAVSLQASVAHVVAKVLARRATPQDEIPILMRTVEKALLALAARATGVADAPPPEAAETQPARPPRERKARAHALAEMPSEPTPAAEPLQPRLLRRAEVVQPSAQPEATLVPPPRSAALRGLVKWYDQHTRRGALQLPGHGDDFAIEAPLLDEMGITRLYKGQEIEAVLSEDVPPRVIRLAVPGGIWQVHPLGGVVHNRLHARPVVVEMKREGLRRAAARVEAEHLLGPTRAR